MATWRPIDTAPKDGTCILLLSKEHTNPADANGGPYHFPPKCSIGRWDPEGDAWCDQYGRYPDDPEIDDDSVTLRVTGVWLSGGGWFQPNEVTHWMPLPDPASDHQLDVIEIARDLVALWQSPQIRGPPRFERNAAIEDTRRRLIEAVSSL